MIPVRLIIPAKRLDLAKSRLDLPPDRRRAVAQALFERTVLTSIHCLGPEAVTVVTSDYQVRGIARRAGVRSVADRHHSLNGALSAALKADSERWPQSIHAVLVSDLPELRPDELDVVLREVERSNGPRHVPDHHGTGTTFASFPPGHCPRVSFGSGSAQRFADIGSVLIGGAPPGMRRDLDTVDDLARALSIRSESAPGRRDFWLAELARWRSTAKLG